MGGDLLDIQKTKDYVQACEVDVIAPLLNLGLDAECYYAYLQEMTRALVGSGELYESYCKCLTQTHEKLIKYYGSKADLNWQFNIGDIFEKRDEFIGELMKRIDGLESLDGIAEAVWGQLDFCLMQLHQQDRTLKTLIGWVPPKILIYNDAVGNQFTRASMGHERLMKELNELRQRLTDAM